MNDSTLKLLCLCVLTVAFAVSQTIDNPKRRSEATSWPMIVLLCMVLEVVFEIIGAIVKWVTG